MSREWAPAFVHHASKTSPGFVSRSWFGSSNLLSPPELGSHSPSFDMGGNEGGGGGGGGGGVDRWSFFGPRPVVQKSPTDPGSDSGPGEHSATVTGIVNEREISMRTQRHVQLD